MRYIVSLAAGILVALGLFLIMHGLISGDSGITDADVDRQRIEFVRVKRDQLENVKERRKPPPPEEPKEPPPPPKLTQQRTDKPPPDMPPIRAPQVNVPFSSGSGPYLGQWKAGDPAAEGDAIPIVRIEPQWPREALLKGISGRVRIELTIAEDGTVDDPRVIESEPRRMFDREAIRAVRKWKFKPRIVDGKPVPRRATVTLEFNLEEDAA